MLFLPLLYSSVAPMVVHAMAVTVAMNGRTCINDLLFGTGTSHGRAEEQVDAEHDQKKDSNANEEGNEQISF